MGHMLKTVNPAAAEAIDNPPAPPDIGTWVVFKGRAGFSRMRRTEFPALVLGASPEDGSLSLMVVMEPEDMMMEDRVPFQSHNQEHFCWRWRRKSDAEDLVPGSDGDLIKMLASRVATIEQVLAGDDLEKLEKRIAVLEAGGKKPGRPKKG